jgi:DNA replication initiation complex subunit (GINS family)
MDEAITFDSVREAYRKERGSAILQAVSPDFYEKVMEYISRKKGELESARERGGRFGNKLVKHHETELENAIMTLSQLVELRERKIVQLSLAQSKTALKSDLNLHQSEKDLFDGILELIRKKRKATLQEDLPVIIDAPIEEPVAGVDKKSEKEAGTSENGLTKVEFIEETSKFLGLDLKTYGPYKKGDTANLPKELIDLLSSKGKAKVVQ